MKKIIFVLIFLIIITFVFFTYRFLNQRKLVSQTENCGTNESITYCSGDKICYSYCNNCECYSLQCTVDSSCQGLFEKKYSVGMRNSLKECGYKSVLAYCSGSKVCSVACDSCGCQPISCFSDTNCANRIP